MINIYEYLLSKSNPKLNMIKATDETIHQIVKDELDRLGHDADLNHIDVSKVTNMYSLFNCVYNPYISNRLGPDYVDLNPNISMWDVSNVTNMDSMFKFCSKFNCDISKWDVSNVKTMYCMFYGCKKFNQDIGGWNVRKVEYHWDMFYNCSIKEEYKPKFKD